MDIKKLAPSIENFLKQLPEGTVLRLIHHKPDHEADNVIMLVIGEEERSVEKAIENITMSPVGKNAESSPIICEIYNPIEEM